MADNATTPDAPAVDADAPTSTVDTTATPDADPAGADALGDAGKKALDAMKADRNTARRDLKAAQDEVARLTAAAEGREAEWKAEQDARAAADKRYAERVLRAELKAAAAGKLADPEDAFRFLDLDDFTPNDSGEYEASDFASAIESLVTSKPYLAAQGDRFTGTPDAGARNAAEQSGQITKDQLASMTPEQINAARRVGRLNAVMGIS